MNHWGERHAKRRASCNCGTEGNTLFSWVDDSLADSLSTAWIIIGANLILPQSATTQIFLFQSNLEYLHMHGHRSANRLNVKVENPLLARVPSNDVFFREKTGGMRKMFKKFADFHFVNAPHVPSVTSEDRGEVRGWWFSRTDDHFSSKDVTDLSTGFDQSVQLILDTIANDGPFDGVLGFSQGASMLHLLLAKAQLGEISLPIEFVILASGFKSLSTQHKAYLDVKIEKPSLHMYGIGDEVVAYTISEKLAENFEEPTKIVHDGGHFIPPMSKYKNQIRRIFGETVGTEA